MATTRLDYPSTIESVTHYPQFQETNEKLTLPNNKKFGVTKRVENRSASSLLQQVTQIKAEYSDVNNGAVPYGNTWLTLRAAEASAYRTANPATVNYNAILPNGQTIILDANVPSVTVDDILGDGAGKGNLKKHLIDKQTLLFLMYNHHTIILQN